MSSMEPAKDRIQPNPNIAADPAQKRAKRVFVGFAATVVVGLAMAGWYLGGRIFAVEKVHAAAMARPLVATPATVPTVANPVPPPLAIAEPVVVEAQPVAEQPADAKPAWNTVNPAAGELYLQLAAMGPNSTNDYLKVLDAKGIHPKVAPGPSENLHRLLIGPYPDKATLEKEQQELEVAGIQFIARRY